MEGASSPYRAQGGSEEGYDGNSAHTVIVTAAKKQQISSKTNTTV